MNNSPRCFIFFIVVVALRHGVAAESASVDTVFFRHFNGDTTQEYVDQKLENASLLVEQMDKDKPTVFYIHGFTEDVESLSTRTVIEGYIKRKDHNVIGTDYRQISQKSRYVKVVLHTEAVGKAVAKGIQSMVNAGLNEEKIHVVGHSLGGQVGGFVGRNLAFNLSRLTALDPAYPLFNVLFQHVSESDAKFVDIMHTDSGFYGQSLSVGHADIFPNKGVRFQPGCPFPPKTPDEEFCSHRRSWAYYAESLRNEAAFLAVLCANSFEFDSGLHEEAQVIPIGIATPSDARGKYYLRTNSTSPFGLGEKGLHP